MTVAEVNSAACPDVGVPVLDTFPPPDGVAQVPSPRQNVDEDADEPLLRLLTDKFPVTPVDRGSPVQLVSVPEVGVPKTGVTIVNDVHVPVGV